MLGMFEGELGTFVALGVRVSDIFILDFCFYYFDYCVNINKIIVF